MANPPKVDILGVQVNVQRFDDAVNTLLEWAHQPQRRYVCTINVNEIMTCRENPAIRQAVNAADMATTDGMPLVWVQRLWGYPFAERVYGPDLMEALCQRSVGTGLTHYFWGGMPGIAERLAGQLKTRYPGLEVAGTYAPPVAPVSLIPDPLASEKLNAVAPDIIWVGLGGPKQNMWMYANRQTISATLMIGVGAAFDFLSGAKQQAPRWMQQNGLEWAFRLASEPRRLWRRYLLYNPRFAWQILRQTMQRSR